MDLFERLGHIFNPNENTMSCTLCVGYGGNCPACEEEPKMTTCPDCSGYGVVFYVGDCIVSKEICDQVLNLVPKACDTLRCELCDGAGEIEEEPYEPDPDEAYDRMREEGLL